MRQRRTGGRSQESGGSRATALGFHCSMRLWAVLLVATLLALPGRASAHEGDGNADLVLSQARAGVYVVTLQVRPAVGVAVAEADVLLPGQTEDGQPLPDGRVAFVVAPLGADGRPSGPWTTVPAMWDRGSAHYRAFLPIGQPGPWAVRVAVESADGRAEVAGAVAAYRPRSAPPPSLLALLTLLPAIALGLVYLGLRALRVPVLSAGPSPHR